MEWNLVVGDPEMEWNLVVGDPEMEWNLVVGDPQMEWNLVVGDPQMEWNFNHKKIKNAFLELFKKTKLFFFVIFFITFLKPIYGKSFKIDDTLLLKGLSALPYAEFLPQRAKDIMTKSQTFRRTYKLAGIAGITLYLIG